MCSSPRLGTVRPRFGGTFGGCLAALCFLGSGPHAAASDAVLSAALSSALAADLENQDEALRAFYAGRADRPLWFRADGSLDPAARLLVQLVETARYDGIERQKDVIVLGKALDRLASTPSVEARRDAELALSRGFADYVQALRESRNLQMIYEDDSLRPAFPTRGEALLQAGQAVSLADYVRRMEWMHPLYAPLRWAAAEGGISGTLQKTVMANLERIRAIPAAPRTRHLLVDTAQAQLWMYDNGKPIGSMRVVVGKPEQQTPVMSGYIRAAIFNPYWNVPPDLVRDRIAPGYLRGGIGYLKAARYELLSDWTSRAQVIDPATVDWHAVAAGKVMLRVRQLPGPGNSMGNVKYEFGSDLGIFLHDTPDKTLMNKPLRQLSSGCIRLEDAVRLGTWLFQGAMPARPGAPEYKVALSRQVPVYVTYLTAQRVGARVAVGPDPYRQDQAPIDPAPR